MAEGGCLDHDNDMPLRCPKSQVRGLERKHRCSKSSAIGGKVQDTQWSEEGLKQDCDKCQ